MEAHGWNIRRRTEDFRCSLWGGNIAASVGIRVVTQYKPHCYWDEGKQSSCRLRGVLQPGPGPSSPLSINNTSVALAGAWWHQCGKSLGGKIRYGKTAEKAGFPVFAALFISYGKVVIRRAVIKQAFSGVLQFVFGCFSAIHSRKPWGSLQERALQLLDVSEMTWSELVCLWYICLIIMHVCNCSDCSFCTDCCIVKHVPGGLMFCIWSSSSRLEPELGRVTC